MFLRKTIIFSLALAFLFILDSKSIFASTFYVSPQSATIKENEVFSIKVMLNTEKEEINAVSSYLNYPEDKLGVVWVNYSGTAFDIAAEESYNGGVVRITRGSITPVKGNVNIATIGFKAKSQGKASVKFANGSVAAKYNDSTDSLSLNKSTGVDFNITKSTSKPNEGEIEITDVVISSITTNSVVINWKTNVKADSYLEYGLEKGSYFQSVSDSAFTTNHNLRIDSSLLVPGLTYYFRLKAKDQEGRIGTVDGQMFKLKGFTVKIKILDKNNKPLKDTKVYLHSENNYEGITNSEGEVTFEDVVPGKHEVVVEKGLYKDKQQIEVGSDSESQFFNIKLDYTWQVILFSPINYVYIGIVCLFFAVILVLYGGKRFSKETKIS